MPRIVVDGLLAKEHQTRFFAFDDGCQKLGNGQRFNLSVIVLDVNRAVGAHRHSHSKRIDRLIGTDRNGHDLVCLAGFLQPNGLLDGDFVKRIHGHLDVGRIDIRVVGQDVNFYVVVHNSLNRNKNSHNKNSNSRPKRAVVENRFRTFLSCTIERRRQL